VFACFFKGLIAQKNLYYSYLALTDSFKTFTKEKFNSQAQEFILNHKNQEGFDFYKTLLSGDIKLKQENLKEAIGLYLEAAKKDNNDAEKEYLVNYKIGSIHLLNENLTLAATYYNKALLVKQNAFTTRLDFMLLFETGLINSYLDNNSKSIEFYLRALNVAKENKWPIKEAAMMNNLGLAYLKTDNANQARKYLFNCLTKRLQIKDTLNYGQIFNNIGTYYLTIGEYENALLYFKKGLSNRQTYKAPLAGLIESKVNIGKAYLKLNKQKEALLTLNQAVTEAVQINHIELERRALEPLISIYENEKAYEKAYQFQKRYYFIKDSLYGLEKVQEIKSLSFQYDFNKRLQQDSLKHVEQNLLNKKQIEIQKERNKTLYVFVIVVVIALLVCAFFINKLNKSNKEKAKAHDLISEQKEELLQKQKEITSSIQYAKRIQEALQPNQRYIKKHLDKNS
jgi:tetratricopeptide (TPR) repeat protein